jgi:ubiquinone/menaquinone biosynthesis C-methylase UbiE
MTAEVGMVANGPSISRDFHDVPAGVRREVVQWDVPTWWRPMEYFGEVVRARALQGKSVLELGARDGGTALYLAKFHGMSVVATDIDPIQSKCRALHERHGVSDLITYDVADATNLQFDDASFDAVVIKSVLGGIAAAAGTQAMARAADEMRRVLRPGGVVLFAENLSASWFHRKARSARAWSGEWHYPSLAEIESVFSRVGPPELKTTGFSAVFVPESFPRLKQVAASIDKCTERLVPRSWQYVGFGHSVKRAAATGGSSIVSGLGYRITTE